jgi:hypothetical protein
MTQVANLRGTRPDGIPVSHQNDFKHVYVGAGLLARGGNPYDARALFETAEILAGEDPRFRSGILPYVYLPFTGQAMRPLAALPFRDAAVAWEAVNHLLLVAALAMGAAAAGLGWNWRTVALASAAVVLNTTLYRQNAAGQLNVALLAAYALVALSLRRGWHPAVAGGTAALAALFKLSPGILLLWFVLTGRRREAAWMIGVGAVVGLLSATLAGWGTTLHFLPLLRDMGYGRSTWGEHGMAFWRDPFNQSLNSFLHHVLVGFGESRPWLEAGAAAANGLTVAAALALLAATARAAWSSRGSGSGGAFDGRQRASFSAAVLASLLLPSLMWDHYLVQAILPCLVLWAVGGRRAKVVIATALVLFSLNLNFGEGWMGSRLLALPPVRLPAGEGVGWLVTSLKLWPVLALFALAVVLSRERNRVIAPETD